MAIISEAEYKLARREFGRMAMSGGVYDILANAAIGLTDEENEAVAQVCRDVDLLGIRGFGEQTQLEFVAAVGRLLDHDEFLAQGKGE